MINFPLPTPPFWLATAITVVLFMRFQLLSFRTPGRGVASEGRQVAQAAASALKRAVNAVKAQRLVAVLYPGLVGQK